jgi:small subunit ribosomal protein S6
MALYDLMLLLASEAPSERHEEILSGVRGAIESGGSLVGEHDWGNRRTAYSIRHRGEAHFVLFQLEAGNELLERLDHNLKITDGVLRFRTIRVRPGAPPPPDIPREVERGRRREEPEPEGTATVAPRAAADAPPREDEEPE